MPLLSASLARVAPSPTIAMSARARGMIEAGRDVIVLTAGEPDFDTPAHVGEAAVRAVAEGRTRYTAPDGISELKRAVAAKFARDDGLDYAPAEISVGTGGKQVIWNALAATIDPGDEVVIPAPYWTSYPDMARLAGGEAVIVPTRPEDGYRLTPEALEAALTPRAKWLILNAPSNPTGAAYSAEQLRALAEVVLRHEGLHVLSDDIYEHILYEGAFATVAAVEPRLRDRTLTVNGVSKSHAMTGWRIGFAGGPERLIAAMRKVQSQTTSNPCSIAQWAAVAALEGPQEGLVERRKAYRARRDAVVAALDACAGMRCPVPDGAFYAYASIEGCVGRATPAGTLVADDEAFATALLEEAGVGAVFGAAFGSAATGVPAIRVSFAASNAALAEGTARIGRFCEALR